MSFPTFPREGEIYRHPNGYNYVFSADLNTWEKFTDNPDLPKYQQKVVKPKPIKLPKPAPTINVTPTSEEIDNELS